MKENVIGSPAYNRPTKVYKVTFYVKTWDYKDKSIIDKLYYWIGDRRRKKVKAPQEGALPRQTRGKPKAQTRRHKIEKKRNKLLRQEIDRDYDYCDNADRDY
ncbi:MAG TPA: hypothetical protein PLO51_00555 [Candidatus Micrarchaeota archaeon]|nr:hypothetical protein [Candidatus Micrarchaeota archaeon]